MPTPARWATAEMGALGSAVKTARAASRITPSFVAACARRPLSPVGGESVMPATLAGTNHSVLILFGTEQFVPLQEVEDRHGVEDRAGDRSGVRRRSREGLLRRPGRIQRGPRSRGRRRATFRAAD